VNRIRSSRRPGCIRARLARATLSPAGKKARLQIQELTALIAAVAAVAVPSAATAATAGPDTAPPDTVKQWKKR
jgi:hypothetical protein